MSHHPSAVIDPAARLDEGVEIAAGVIIGADVEIGRGTQVGPYAVINGPTRIGTNNRIAQFVSLGNDPQDKKYQGERTYLTIGNDNAIREYASIHRGTIGDQGLTKIGDRNLLMAYVHVAHDCVIGSDVVMSNGASLAGHVHLDNFVTLGGFTLVHQFGRIGTGAFSGMGSVLNQDVPPYVLVSGHPGKPYGINAEGMRRQGYEPDEIATMKQAYRVLYASQLRLDEAIDELRTLRADFQPLQQFIDFIAVQGRGLIR